MTCPLCTEPKLKIRVGGIVFHADMTPGTICRLLDEDGDEIAWTASVVPHVAMQALNVCGKHMSALLKAVPLYWLS